MSWYGFGSAVGPLAVPVTQSVHQGHYPIASDTVSVAPALNSREFDVIADSFGVSYLITEVRNFPVTISQGIGLGPTLLFTWGVVVNQTIGVAEALLPNVYYQRGLSDDVGAGDAIAAGVPVVLADTVGVELTQVVSRIVIVAEELGILPLLAPVGSFQLSLTQGIGIDPTLLRFLGGSLAETLGVGGSLAGVGLGYRTISQGIGVAPALNPQLVLRAVAADDIGVSPAFALQALMGAVVLEGIELSAAYIAPNGNITTWVMNTRTGAVSEYDNYDYNSFTRMGSKYIGASSTGLYELLGEDDDGDPIVARIKSGLLQFGGTHLSRLKAAYLATRGADDFVLRIDTGDDTYDYAVNTRDMRSTKVHMGKGQRARYFSFELISTGADFDLETLEFVPIVVQRRV